MIKKIRTEELLMKAKAELFKDSLENLSLYLNEIEKIVNLPSDVSTDEEKQYKLKILESYISNMGDIMKVISSEGKNENIILS